VANDSIRGAAVNSISNRFNDELSTTDTDERKVLLNTVQQQRGESNQALSAFPSVFFALDEAGSRFPAMKEASTHSMDENLGAPKGRRRESASITAGEEIARGTEIAPGIAIAAPKPEFDVIRL
jgi:hypothetical protein